MSKRSEKVGMYVTPEQKEELKRRADSEDMTLSAFCHDIVKRYLHGELFTEKAEELKIERRFEELIGLAREEIEQAAEDMQQVQQTTALHCVANWELQKEAAGAVQRNEAMAAASQRLHEDFVKAGMDPASPTESTGQTPSSAQDDYADRADQTDQPEPSTSSASPADEDDDNWRPWKDDDSTDQADTAGAPDAQPDDSDDGDWRTWEDDDEDDQDDDDYDTYIDRDWDI